MSPPKKCAVCGDKALGYNFNAVTCESCKAFFRRNALVKKQFTCPFNQNCDITVVTRRFCQKCRLKKCLSIGMKSENIMSEEDKQIKRRKIETNRAKRRLTEGPKDTEKHKHDDSSAADGASGAKQEKQQQQAVADSSGYDAYASYDSQSCGSFDSGTGQGSNGAATSSSTVLLSETMRDVNPELMTGEEMVEFIVCDPDRACQAISKLMRTPAEGMACLDKIISSQKEALKLIEHLIAYPGDALKIISKIMNSPFNALSVFTKFMSSPTDALEIISKVVSSPQDVLQFIKNLMDSPEDAIDIMNKFMNTPAEALRILNKIFNGSSGPELLSAHDSGATMPAATPVSNGDAIQTTNVAMSQTLLHFSGGEAAGENSIINSMLSGNTTMPPPVASPQPLTPHTPLTPQTPMESHTPLTPLTSTPTSPQTNSTYAPSPQTTLSLASPLSMTSNDMQYHSPASNSLSHDELPSTSSARLMASSPTQITSAVNDFASEHFDIKSAMQNAGAYCDDNAALGAGLSTLDSISSLDSVLTEVIRIEFQAFNNLPPEPRIKQEQHLRHRQQHCQSGFTGCNSHVPQPLYAPSNGRELNEPEQMKLRELRLASEALYFPVDDDLSMLMMGDYRIKPEETQQDPKLLQVINLTAVAIKRLIKMAKKITAFRDMCQEDQVALLKGGCTEMMIMRSVMSYDGDLHTWKIPHTQEGMSNIRAEVLKLAKGNVYEEHLKFIRTFDDKWRMDENIILIMCAIVLFTPTRPRIIHSDVIRLEQNSYYYLLRRYLESVYPGCEAKSAFIKLIQKISDVERLNQFIIGVYLNVNPSQVEPLLREIFDLKNH